MSEVVIECVDTGQRLVVPITATTQYRLHSLEELQESVSTRLNAPADQLTFLSSEGQLLTSRKPLAAYGPVLTLFTQKTIREGITVELTAALAPAALPPPVSNIERGLLDKEEKLFAIAQRAQAVATVLRQHQKLREQSRGHCLVMTRAAELLQKNKRGFVEKALRRCTAVLERSEKQRAEARMIADKVAAEVERLKSINLHPALVLEERRTLSDLFTMLWTNSYEEKLFEALQQLQAKSDQLRSAIAEVSADISGSPPPPLRFDDSGYESECQQAERLVAAYLNFRAALEARKPLEGGLPQLDQYYELVSRFESLQGPVARRSAEIVADYQRTAGYLKQCLASNVDTTSRVRASVAAPTTLIKGLVERAQQLIDYLAGGLQLEAAYTNMLSEIARRRQFAQLCQQQRQELLAFIDSETKLREEFCANYGKFLPKTLIPQLSDAPDSVFLYPNRDSDHLLPDIGPIEPKTVAPKPAVDNEQILTACVEKDIQIATLTRELESVAPKIAQLDQELQATALKCKEYKKEAELAARALAKAESEAKKEKEESQRIASTLQSFQFQLEKQAQEQVRLKEYSSQVSADLHNLRQVNEKLNNEVVMQKKEIDELKLRMRKAMEDSAMQESMKLQADASSSEYRAKIDQLRAHNYKLRKKLKSTIHFTEFLEGSLALFFPSDSGFAAFHLGSDLIFLDPKVLSNHPELR